MPIIDHQCKLYCSGDVFPKFKHEWDFIIAMFGQALLKDFIGQCAGSGFPIHTFSHFNIYINILFFFMQGILLNKLFMNEVNWIHVFESVKVKNLMSAVIYFA